MKETCDKSVFMTGSCMLAENVEIHNGNYFASIKKT